jgi:hypothetical protein
MEDVAVSFEIEIPPCVPGVHHKLLRLWILHHLQKQKRKHGSDQMDGHNYEGERCIDTSKALSQFYQPFRINR